jgi:two-component system, cell cycle response regulator
MRQPPRILVASEREEVLRPVRVALSGEFDLREAGSAVHALERSRGFEADLAVVDMALPGDALDLLRVLDACRRPEQALPLIALAPDRAAAIAAMRSGAADALVGPCDSEELSAHVQALLRLKAAHDQVHERASELERLSLTDNLTGLGNRRLFDARLHAEYLRAQRFGEPLSLLLLDLDHFKSVNDRHGHVVGDDLLRAVSVALGAEVRGVDLVCRYGGEEFAVLLPRTDMAGATAVARRLCEAVAATSTDSYGERVGTTTSVGAATLPGDDIHDERDLVRAADAALYRAKRNGRARVCAWPRVDTVYCPDVALSLVARA